MASFDADTLLKQLKEVELEEADRKAYERKIKECKALKEEYDSHQDHTSTEANGILTKIAQGFQDLKNMEKEYEEKYEVQSPEPTT